MFHEKTAFRLKETSFPHAACQRRGEVAGQSAMDMAIADAAGDPSRHVRHVGPMPAVRED